MQKSHPEWYSPEIQLGNTGEVSFFSIRYTDTSKSSMSFVLFGITRSMQTLQQSHWYSTMCVLCVMFLSLCTLTYTFKIHHDFHYEQQRTHEHIDHISFTLNTHTHTHTYTHTHTHTCTHTHTHTHTHKHTHTQTQSANAVFVMSINTWTHASCHFHSEHWQTSITDIFHSAVTCKSTP